VAGRGGADGAGCRARPARRGRAGPAVSRGCARARVPGRPPTTRSRKPMSREVS
jgi:hypothetical protein